jgi:NADPH2:quinone reductase
LYERNQRHDILGEGEAMPAKKTTAKKPAASKTAKVAPIKAHAIRIYELGGPDVMKFVEVEVPPPGPGQVRVRHTAIGVNLADTYNRKGEHHGVPLPSGLGLEAAGVIEAIGPNVKGFKVGEHVVGMGGNDAYCEARLYTEGQLIKLPKWLDDRTAVAALVKGTTTQYLFNDVRKLKRGDVVLFHAAAGGVGQVAGQWAKDVGARMIGTVSTPEKAKIAKKCGYTHVIDLSKQNITEEVMKLTNGQGVDVIYDSNGKDTWDDTLKSVKRRGMIVTFGSASGAPPAVDLHANLGQRSVYFIRATSVNFMTSPEIRRNAAKELFKRMKSGVVKVKVNHVYALKEVAQAHRDVEARKTTGSIVLIP